jgi:hypothetical protein
MFNLGISRANFRGTAVALGTIVGTLTFSHAAGAGPLPPSPFVLALPVQTSPGPQTAPSQEGVVAEMPARLKRQLVNYGGREAPGTIIIDTPNTNLYLVFGL